VSVDECLGIFVGQPSGPILKAFLGNLGAFRVWVLKGAPKFCPPTPIQLTAYCLGDELAAVLLVAIDIPEEIVG
jgi:hypothetical protein